MIDNAKASINSVQDYVYYLMLKRTTYSDHIVVEVKREDLVSPNFSRAIRDQLFVMLAGGKRVEFHCIDKDLYFRESEALKLLGDYEYLKAHGCELYFRETLDDMGIEFSLDEADRLDYFTIGSNNKTYENDDRVQAGKLDWDKTGKTMTTPITFDQVMEANSKILSVANKINRYAEEHNISPFEKFLICRKYICKKIEYITEPVVDTHSYIGTILAMKGCCSGEAQSLRILLKLCGINSFCISTDINAKDVNLSLPLMRRYSGVNTLIYEGKELTIDEYEKICIDKINSLESKEMSTNHAINIVQIDDDKYGMHGIGATDPTGSNDFELLFIKDKECLNNLFNFSSYIRLLHGNGFEEFIRNVEQNTISKDDYKKIDEDIFSFAKMSIIEQIKGSTPKKLTDEDHNAMAIFLNAIIKCKTLSSLEYIMDLYSMGQNSSESELARHIFPRIKNNKLGAYCLIKEAISSRATLENLPRLEPLSVDDYAWADIVSDKAYNAIFPEDSNNTQR